MHWQDDSIRLNFKRIKYHWKMLLHKLASTEVKGFFDNIIYKLLDEFIFIVCYYFYPSETKIFF